MIKKPTTLRCFPVSVAHTTSDCWLGAHKAPAFIALVLAVVMGADVLGLRRAEFKVLDSIISLDAVYVMDGLALLKRPTKMLFHRKPMEQKHTATSADDQVAHFIDGAMTAAPTLAVLATTRAVVSSHALPRATECLVFGKPPFTDSKRLAARNTGDISHVSSLPQLKRQENG